MPLWDIIPRSWDGTELILGESQLAQFVAATKTETKWQPSEILAAHPIGQE